MDEEEFQEFTNNFYRSGSPEKAPEALAYLVKSDLFVNATPHNIEIMRYLFGRIGEDRPEILRGYESVLEKSNFEGRDFIISLLGSVGDERTGALLKSLITDSAYDAEWPTIEEALAHIGRERGERNDPLRLEIVGPEDLDLLWAEFLVTGNKRAVRRIIQTLEWRDLVRERLEVWMHSEPSFRFFGLIDLLRDRRLKQLQTLVGIECHFESKSIETVEDLDCWCMLEKMEMSSLRFEAAKNTLPFDLAGEDLSHLGGKASAKWSLYSNSKQHPLVLEACEEGILRTEGRAKLALLEIVVNAHLFHRNFDAAAGYIRQYLLQIPSHSDMLAALLKAEYEIDLDWLKKSIGKEFATRKSDLAIPSESGRTCAEKTRETSTYATRVTLRDPRDETTRERDYVVGEWSLEFRAPNQLHVTQFMFPQDYDEWISLGPDTYLNIGGWLQVGESLHEDLNQLLPGGKWLEVMQVVPPVAESSYLIQSKHYLLLEYVTKSIGDFLDLEPKLIEMLALPGEIRIWIDASTMLLAKAELNLDGRLPDGEEVYYDIQQVFTAYNRDFRIDAPILDLV